MTESSDTLNWETSLQNTSFGARISTQWNFTKYWKRIIDPTIRLSQQREDVAIIGLLVTL